MSSVASTHDEQHDRQVKEQIQYCAGSFSSVSSAGSASSLRSLVLCREGIPPMLEDLYKVMDVGTIHEAAWVVIHVLMLETGYICGSEVTSNLLQ